MLITITYLILLFYSNNYKFKVFAFHKVPISVWNAAKLENNIRKTKQYYELDNDVIRNIYSLIGS